jgi:hypothetical protein
MKELHRYKEIKDIYSPGKMIWAESLISPAKTPEVWL